MSSTTSARRHTEAGHPRRKIWIIALAAAGVVATGVVVVVVLVLVIATTKIPQFGSLADTPDPRLLGTVAYYADSSACVRIVAAAGQPSKDVLCLPDQDPQEAKQFGKLVGPQLAWRSDGRLEVTMFRLTDPPGPNFNPGWQKLVDVRTGQVQEVSAASVPSTPNLDTEPTLSPDGRKVTSTSDNGRISVVLQDATGSRTLLSARGPADGYSLSTAFWAPNWQWIAADDGRILIITTDNPAVTRVLTAESTQGGYGGYPASR
jgi:hypothetical protein